MKLFSDTFCSFFRSAALILSAPASDEEADVEAGARPVVIIAVVVTAATTPATCSLTATAVVERDRRAVVGPAVNVSFINNVIRNHTYFAVSRELLRGLLRRLEETLSPLGRQLFELIFLQERSVADVEDAMGMTSDAVYAWRSRLRRLSRRLLDDMMKEGMSENRPYERTP